MGILLLISILLLAPVPSWAEPSAVTVSMVSANSIDKELPFVVLTGGAWQPEYRAEYVKIHIFPDSETVLSGFEVESCRASLRRFSVYVNYDEALLYVGGTEEKKDTRYYNLNESTLTVRQRFDKPLPVRSLTFNFEQNVDLCIAQIRLLDRNGTPLAVKTPRVTDGTVAATSTLDPALSYDVMNLFDSRFEYAWASNKKATGVDLTFNFAQEESVEKIMIWNGYQRSDVHCQANSRVKTLRLTGDNSYETTLTVSDQMGSQVLDLPKPFKGKRLTLSVVEAYTGKTYEDLVISELRFYDGNRWFMLNPLASIHAVTAHNRNEFEKAGLAHVLNQQLETDYDFGWLLRLRADGTVYIQGSESVRLKKANMRFISGLGNYEVLSSGREKGIKLRIFGFLRESLERVVFDCNGCGRDCNTSKTDPKIRERIFQQYVSLKAIDEKRIRLTNESPVKKLKFKDVELYKF